MNLYISAIVYLRFKLNQQLLILKLLYEKKKQNLWVLTMQLFLTLEVKHQLLVYVLVLIDSTLWVIGLGKIKPQAIETKQTRILN